MIGIQGENGLEEVTKSPPDTSLDANSTNAVENRVVTSEINKKQPFCSIATVVTSVTLDSTSYAFTIPSDGFYSFRLMSGSSTAHDMYILINNIEVAHRYIAHHYDRLNAFLPLKKNTVVNIYGASNDALSVTMLS